MERISKRDYYLNIAKAVCKRSTCLRRRYGCVIVKNDEIIATGYNGAPRGAVNCCDTGECMREGMKHNSGDYSECHSVHAEQNALISASRRDMIGATLYLYGEERGLSQTDWEEITDTTPCPICGRMIANAGIDRVVSSRSEVE